MMTFCTYPIVSSILKMKLDMLLGCISICTLCTFLEKYRRLLLLTDSVVSVVFCFFFFFRFPSFSVPVTSVSVPGIDPECSVCCFYSTELFHFCHVSTFCNVMNSCCTGIKVEEQLVIRLFGSICCTGPFSCSSLSKSLALDLSSLENGCCTVCSHHI